jgi:hypothetical protein
MMGAKCLRRVARTGLLVLAVLVAVGATGCQVDIGGQVHPSGYYMSDDVQLFTAGPEFKHANEAAALRQQAQEAALQRP